MKFIWFVDENISWGPAGTVSLYLYLHQILLPPSWFCFKIFCWLIFSCETWMLTTPPCRSSPKILQRLFFFGSLKKILLWLKLSVLFFVHTVFNENDANRDKCWIESIFPDTLTEMKMILQSHGKQMFLYWFWYKVAPTAAAGRSSCQIKNWAMWKENNCL